MLGWGNQKQNEQKQNEIESTINTLCENVSELEKKNNSKQNDIENNIHTINHRINDLEKKISSNEFGKEIRYHVQSLQPSLQASLQQSIQNSIEQSSQHYFRALENINSKLDSFTRKEAEQDIQIKRLIEENTALKSSYDNLLSKLNLLERNSTKDGNRSGNPSPHPKRDDFKRQDSNKKFDDFKRQDDIIKFGDFKRQDDIIKFGDFKRQDDIIKFDDFKRQDDTNKFDDFKRQDDIIKLENYNKSCILLSIDRRTTLDMFKRNLMIDREAPNLYESMAKSNQFKIYDINWFCYNMSRILENCFKVEFKNVNGIDIYENIEISNKLLVNSSTSTNLNLKNNSTLIVNANVKLNNINIMDCNYDENYLIDIKSGSTLEFSKGSVERNSGNGPIIHIESNGNLNLDGIIFRKNLQYKEKVPCCIKAENNGNININKCEFLNHTSQKYPYSAFVIGTKGDLNIKSSKFDDNKADVQYFSSIRGYGKNAKINMDNITFKNCCYMYFINCENINIKKGDFFRNNSIDCNGGCFYIKESKNISIDRSVFKNNQSYSGGAIYFENCTGDNSLKNCTFEGNNATGRTKNIGNGGAIDFKDVAYILILDTIFNRNKAVIGNGGALHASNSSKVVCGGCTFKGNTAEKGGAIFTIDKFGYAETKSNTFNSNKALIGDDDVDHES